MFVNLKHYSNSYINLLPYQALTYSLTRPHYATVSQSICSGVYASNFTVYLVDKNNTQISVVYFLLHWFLESNYHTTLAFIDTILIIFTKRGLIKTNPKTRTNKFAIPTSVTFFNQHNPRFHFNTESSKKVVKECWTFWIPLLGGHLWCTTNRGEINRSTDGTGLCFNKTWSFPV